MRVGFFASEKPRERLLADAFIRGLEAHGDTGRIIELTGEPIVAEGCEAAVMVGVKSRALYQANTRAGVHVVMMDKGYARHKIDGPVRIWEYWRVAIDGHHPTRHLMREARAHDRMKKLGLSLNPWRKSGEHILFAGSSAKYHEFYGLDNPTAYAKRVIRKLRHLSNRPIIYRPKPSWRDAEPIAGSTYSSNESSITSVLSNCHAMVTHGSNACFEAVLSGVPCIVLGDAVARPISDTSIHKVLDPYLASEDDRRQWLANLAYCQWTMREFESGEAWAVMRPQVYG